MCGIAGIVGPGKLEHSVLEKMCGTLVHRGPDEAGLLVKSSAAFGMRRLRIIDLAGGKQPIFNEDRTVWVVFNGEIYNFREQQRELERRGHRFRSNSDTEIIVHLYEDFGDNCVDKLRGMFAFALYDENSNRLLLARDRLGKKPLYYALSDDRLIFGSEIKAILAAAPHLSSVNPRALLQYFYFGYIPDPETCFLGIRKLPPAHILNFENGKIQIRKYWDLPPYGVDSPANEQECLDLLEAKLEEAVSLRLIADVPLGALLSGGTDSSTIVALMARLSSAPVKTFCIGFRHSDFDEAGYARKVARRFGTEHHELVVEPNIEETMLGLAGSMDEPFGDSSMLPTYCICSLARRYVTVVLSGDGGDEAFGGYERYWSHQERSKYSVPQWAGRLYRNQIYRRLPHGTKGRNLAYSLSLPPPERYFESVSIVATQRNYEILSQDFLKSSRVDADPLDIFRAYIRDAPATDELSRILYLDSKTYLPGDILTKVDRMSMACSLEARAPLLDHILLEWVAGLSAKWKISKRGQKLILTKLAERLGVPREVLYRPKQGFALPLTYWMRNELKEFVQDLLLDPRTLQRGYFSESGLRRLLAAFFCGEMNDCHEIWRLMMFELWYRNFVDQSPADAAFPMHVPVADIHERAV